MGYRSRDKECHLSRSKDNTGNQCSGWNSISGSTNQDQESAVTKSSALPFSAGRKQIGIDLYKEDLVQYSEKEDLVQYSENEDLVGMVMEIAGDSDLDSCTSDSEDQDESESLFEGHARVIWASLAETIEKIDDILVVDRRFPHGDIVASVSDPSGQTGLVTKVDVLVDLKAPDGEIIRNVDAKKLVRVCTFEVADYVIRGSWLGMVVEIDQNITVLFNDNAKCKIRRPDPESLVSISQNPFNDEENLYYPGQRVHATTSKVFKVAQWLQGKWKTGRSEGIITNVEVESVYVKWLASALPSTDTQPVIVPEKQQDPKKLTLLSCFLYSNWQLGDWCLLPSNANLSRSLFVQDAATDGALETVMEKDNLKSDLRSNMTDALHNTEHCRRVTNDSNEVQKKEEDIEHALFVVNTRTTVDVLWQDGSHSFSLDSRTLFSVEYLGVQDFWPEQFVLEKGHDDDAIASNARRTGVVKSMDSMDRTVTVKWLKPKEHPQDLFEFDKEEIVSVYELDMHPDYACCIGDVVVRVSSVKGTLAGSANVISFLPNKECQSNLESEKDDEAVEQICGDEILGLKNVKGGCTEELYLSCFGYIIGIKDGEIEVAWADGMVSKVGPQDIIVVYNDDDDNSSETSSEGNSSEVKTDWDDDDVVSTVTVDSHGIADREHACDVAESSKKSTIDTCTRTHCVIADIEHRNDVVESLNQRNDHVFSIPQAAYGFISRVAMSLLGFQGLKMLPQTPSSSFQEEPAEKNTLGNTELRICQEKEVKRDSDYHLPEFNASNSRDRAKAVDDSVLAHGGKVKPAVWASKDDLKDADCRVEHQSGSVRENLDDLGVLTPNTVKKQEREDGSLPDVYDHGNEDKCFKQFDSVNDAADHFFLNKTNQTGSQRQWIKKVQKEWAILENNLPDTVYVRVYEDRTDLLRAAIIGAAGTPYQDGLFFFDIHLPSVYPQVPPSVHYHSCGLQLNPNLYENGTLCLSLLNTWTGSGNEVWSPKNSSILQVLVSIQGLVLNEKPYFNEAGYDKQIGRAEAEKNSVAYNENSFLLSCKSMLCLLRKPPKHFESFVKEHFRKRGHYILAACNSYMKGAQVGSLSGEAVLPLNDETNLQCSSSHGFRLMLAKIIPKLASAFREAGGDCDKFLQQDV